MALATSSGEKKRREVNQHWIQIEVSTQHHHPTPPPEKKKKEPIDLENSV